MKVGINRIARIVLGSLIMVTCATLIYRPGKATAPANISEEDGKLNIIIDMGGVLFDTDKTRALWYLGPKALFYHWYSKRNNTRTIRNIFYATLNNISGSITNQYNAQDDEGNLLPQLLCDWLTGSKSPRELRKITLANIKEHAEWFASNTERQLATRMAKMVFTPKIFVHTRKLIKETVDLIKEYKEKGHRVFILSNWDAESFDLLQKKYPEIFALFDGIIISSHVNDMKPNQSIYQHVTTTLPAETCIFIDDQKENIQAARSCGMHGIHCRKKNGMLTSGLNIKSIRRQLERIEESRGITLEKSKSRLSLALYQNYFGLRNRVQLY